MEPMLRIQALPKSKALQGFASSTWEGVVSPHRLRQMKLRIRKRFFIPEKGVLGHLQLWYQPWRVANMMAVVRSGMFDTAWPGNGTPARPLRAYPDLGGNSVNQGFHMRYDTD